MRAAITSARAAPFHWGWQEEGMLRGMSVRRVGVEEEHLLVDPRTGQPRAVAGMVLGEAGEHRGGAGTGAGQDTADVLDFELQLQQMETNTRPCRGLDELGREVRRCRAWAGHAAGRAGVQVAALATSPVLVEPEVVDKGRYQKMTRRFGLTAQEQPNLRVRAHIYLLLQ